MSLPTVTVLPGKRISFRLHSQFRCMPSVGRQMITGSATGRSVLRWWEGLPNGAFINNFMPIPFGGFGGVQAPAAQKKRLVVDQTWLGDPPPPLVSYFGMLKSCGWEKKILGWTHSPKGLGSGEPTAIRQALFPNMTVTVTPREKTTSGFNKYVNRN